MGLFVYDRDLRHEIVKGKVQFLLSLRISEFKYIIDRNCHGEKKLRSREFYFSQGWNLKTRELNVTIYWVFKDRES